MNLRFLGTKGNITKESKKHKKHSSLLIDKDNFSLLIDWGETHKDETLPDVDAILITHAHPDHSGGLGNTVDKLIYLSDRTAEILKENSFENTHIFKQKETEVLNVGPFEITTFPMLHSKLASMTGFKIDDENNVLLYAPDALWIPNRDKILKDVEVYIGDGSFLSDSKILKNDETREEYGHASIKAQLAWLEKAGIKKAIFTHFGKEVVELSDKVLNGRIKELSRERGIEVLLAEDGMNISVSALMGLEKVVHPDEQLFRAMAELLQSEDFTPSVVDYDVQHPKTKWKELIVDLWYLGNTGYPKLKKGTKWGDWTVDLCLKYFAKSVDALRSVYFPIVPPEEGERIYNTAYWRCYREAENYMETEPPSDVEEWDKKRKDILKLEKEPLEVKPEAGIYMAQPHARYIVNGDKKAIVKTRKFTKYMNEPLYLLSKGFCFGIIKYTEPREIDLKEFKELQDVHRVTDRERIKWWGERETFYFYPLEVIEVFDEPRRYKKKVGVQCYDEESKILTENGWKTFQEVSLEDRVFFKDRRNGSIGLRFPKHIVNENYKGKMYNFGGYSTSYDFCVTPNHRMWVKTKTNKNKFKDYRIEEMANLPNRFYIEKSFDYDSEENRKYETIPSAIRQNGYRPSEKILSKEVNLREWLRFLGFFIAEGCLVYDRNGIYLTQKDKDLLREYQSLLISWGFKPRIVRRYDKEVYDLNVYDIQLFDYLRKLVPRGAKNKKIPRKYLGLSRTYLKSLFRGLMEGDGSKRNYSTSSRALAEQVQELYIKTSGKPATVYKANRGDYLVSLCSKTEGFISFGDSGEIVEYEGRVGCVDVGGDLIYVKRNKQPFWCGNTFQTPIEFLEGDRQDLADGRFVLRKHGWGEAFHFDFVLNLGEGKLREYHIWKKNPLEMSKGEKALGDNEKICPHLESFTFEGEVEPDAKGWKGLFNPTKEEIAYVKILDRGTADVIESKAGFRSWSVHGKKMSGLWTWNKADDKYYFGRSKTAVPIEEDEDYLSKQKEG